MEGKSKKDEPEEKEVVKNASSKIKEVLKGIIHVNTQTDMLSFNASVIAAKMGSEGLGIEVIANEMKQLATVARNSISEIQRGA